MESNKNLRPSVTLPAPLGAFVSYQEWLIGRGLDQDERRVVAAWLGIINDVATGELDMVEALKFVDDRIGHYDGHPAIQRGLGAAHRWIQYAGEEAQS